MTHEEGTTKARATRKYADKFADLRVRVTPELYEAAAEHSVACKESLRGFVARAITETIERDKKKAE